jgi:uncharacterized membrane protein YhhN
MNGGTFLKAATSFGFLLVALNSTFFALSRKNGSRKFALLMLLGVASSFLGDIILNTFFRIGALIFALGHIFYFSAYCSLSSYRSKDFLIGLLIFIPSASFIFFYPFFNFGGAFMKAVCIVYALIISTMLSKAISLLFQKKSRFSIMVFAGSLLFFISDIALLFYMFGGAGDAANTLCLVTYFPAQVILALSVFEFSKEF